MTGRAHDGDENGNTRYQCAYPLLIDDVRSILVTNPDQSPWVKESHSFFVAPANCCLTGRAHFGDENGDTAYTYMSLYLKNNAPWQFYLPIIRTPAVDNFSYPLVRMFINVTTSGANTTVRYIPVFKGEGAYSNGVENSIASLFYKAFTFNEWDRTADIEQFTINFVNDEPVSIKFNSYSGAQTFQQGKTSLWAYLRSLAPGNQSADVLPNFAQAFVDQLAPYLAISAAQLAIDLGHVQFYDDNISDDLFLWDTIEKQEDGRPIVYINTANHLFGPVDNNSSYSKTNIWDYKMTTGNRQDASVFAKSLPLDINLTLATILKYTFQFLWKK